MTDETSTTTKKTPQKTELEKLKGQLDRLEALQAKCVADHDKAERKKRLKLEKEMAARSKEENALRLVQSKLKERGIRVGVKDRYNVREAYGSRYGVEYDADRDVLSFPVLFMYVEFDESDFIRSFGENQRFAEHLGNMFAPKAAAPSWDKQGKYLSHRLRVYYETEERFVHVNTNKTLKEIVQREDYVVPVLPVFFVLCKDSDFSAAFLKRKYDALVN